VEELKEVFPVASGDGAEDFDTDMISEDEESEENREESKLQLGILDNSFGTAQRKLPQPRLSSFAPREYRMINKRQQSRKCEITKNKNDPLSKHYPKEILPNPIIGASKERF
jgi:hypothetical protein